MMNVIKDFFNNLYRKFKITSKKEYVIASYLLTFIHFLLPFLIALVLLFSDDILNLFILCFICNLILFVNYRCNDCPVSYIEDHYKSPGFADTMGKFMFGDKYKKETRSIITKELIWIAILLILTKICGILFIKSLRPYLLKVFMNKIDRCSNE